jgi:RND family efflux transporter MFP subunit
MRIFRRPPIGRASPRRWFAVLAYLMVAGLLSVFTGCQQPATPPPAAAAEASQKEPLKVAVVKPERKTIRRLLKRPGYNSEPYQSTPLYAKISGYVGKWDPRYDIGRAVRRGEVLAELRVPEMEVEVQQKEATVLQVEAEIQQARAEELRAQAEYDRTKSQSERMARVDRTGVVTKEVVDEARLSFEAAAAGVAKAKADVKVAEARLRVARKAHEYAQTLLQYTQIRAPFDGVITQRKINEGDFVQPAVGTKGDALFVVDQVDPVRVFVNVPEAEAAWVRDGAAVTVRSPGLPGEEFQGTVARNSQTLNPTNRTLRTEIDLPNPERKLLPGMYVDVTIVVEHRDVRTLPESAVVMTEEGQTFCYLLQGDKAVRTAVRVGLTSDRIIEVLKKQKPGKGREWEDFTGQEDVIISNPATLTEGQAVTVSHAG